MGVVRLCSRTFGLATRKRNWLCGNPGVTWEPVSVILLYVDWLVAHEDSVISQPRIAVLGLSQPYVFMCLDYWLLVVVVLGFQPYLRFKLRFKPSAYLYLRTSSKTKDRYLGLLQSLLSSQLIFYHLLTKGLVSVRYYKGSQVSSHLVLVTKSVLVPSQPSDVTI